MAKRQTRSVDFETIGGAKFARRTELNPAVYVLVPAGAGCACIWPTVREWPGAISWRELAQLMPGYPGTLIEIRDDDAGWGEPTMRTLTKAEAVLYCWLQVWANS